METKTTATKSKKPQNIGTKIGYETTFITRPDLSDEQLKALHEKIKQIILAAQGEVIITEDLGKKRLAYVIQKESRGNYSYFVFTGKLNLVHEIERNLRIHEHVIRFLTVKISEQFSPEQFVKRRNELQLAAKKREEQRMMKREDRRREYQDDYDSGEKF